MNLIAQTVADGLVLGGIYALAAVGFSLIFGVLHVINLSHGIIVLMRLPGADLPRRCTSIRCSPCRW